MQAVENFKPNDFCFVTFVSIMRFLFYKIALFPIQIIMGFRLILMMFHEQRSSAVVKRMSDQ